MASQLGLRGAAGNGAAPTLHPFPPSDAQFEYLGQPLPSAVASGAIHVKLVIPYPGAPLPDLLDALFSGAISSISGHIVGDGPLRAGFGVPEGTPGKFLIGQTGLLSIPGRGKGVVDGFPAELVRVFKAGN